jgi:calcium permeable stress-gated cation channel
MQTAYLTLRRLENPWINAESDLNSDAPHQSDPEREESAASSLSLGDTHIVRTYFPVP